MSLKGHTCQLLQAAGSHSELIGARRTGDLSCRESRKKTMVSIDDHEASVDDIRGLE